MLKHIISALLALALSTLSAVSGNHRPLSLADPYILLHQGIYYAYGTSGDQGIEVYTSSDLRHWTSQGFALRREHTTCPRWFWAPEVYEANGRFLMYFSGNEKIRAAWADTPTGPFHEQPSGPLFAEEGNIDHHLYRQGKEGKPYMFFVRFDHGNIIYSCEMEPDLTTMRRSTLRRVSAPEQPWEKLLGTVNEGPFVIEHQGTYYMTYSGNGYTSPDYAVGVATSQSLDGPWQKADYNPILVRPDTLVGVGHHSFFYDKRGRLRIVFHAHASGKQIHPRDMHIAKVKFRKNPAGGPDILCIDTRGMIHCKNTTPKAK